MENSLVVLVLDCYRPKMLFIVTKDNRNKR